MTQTMAAIRGTSVSSAGESAPRRTSNPMAAKVVPAMAASTHKVAPVVRTRKLYSSAKETQIKWKGMASHRSKSRMPASPSIHSTTHARSIQLIQASSCSRSRVPKRKAGRRGACHRSTADRTTGHRSWPAGGGSGRAASGSESISCTAHRLDQVEAELGPEPAHADVDHVRARVEVQAPYRGQQRVLSHGLARVLHQLAEQHDLKPGQRHRTDPCVGLHPAEVQHQVADPDQVRCKPTQGSV